MKSALLIGGALALAVGAVYLLSRRTSAAPAARGRGRYRGDVSNPKKYAGDAQQASEAYAAYTTGGVSGVAGRYAPEVLHAVGLG